MGFYIVEHSPELGHWYDIKGSVDEFLFVLESADSCDEQGYPRVVEKGSEEWGRLENYCDRHWPEFVHGHDFKQYWRDHCFEHYPHIATRR